MGARTPSVTGSKTHVITPAVEKKHITFDATVSTDDTIPLGNALADILYVKLCKKSDGTDVSCTEATNIVTVTQASLTDVPVLGFAYGT